MKLFVFIIYSISQGSVFGDSNFNYDVGLRVKDKIADYLQMISSAGSLPSIIVVQQLVNISILQGSCPTIFYPSMMKYGSQVPKFYLGLEDGTFCSYFYIGSTLYSFLGSKCAPGTSCVRSRYNVNPANGVALSKTGYNESYDCRQRPWYKQAKNNQGIMWVTPYLDATTGYPVITVVSPVMNLTINNMPYTFTGSVGADIYLTDISKFLVNSFSQSNRKVFIIDALTGNLMGSSMGAATSIKSSSGISFVQAIASSDNIISGATQLLTKANFPADLILFNGYYLQSVVYTDIVPILKWYIVVLMPAVLDVDHLGPDSILYTISIVIISFTIAVCSIVLCLTILCRKKRIVKLYQPFLLLTTHVGGIILAVTCYFLLGENTITTCAIRPYMSTIGATISFSPLLFKSMKAHFVLSDSRVFTIKEFKNQWMHMGLASLLIIDVFILAVSLYPSNPSGTNPYTTTVLSSNGAYSSMTYCGYHNNSILSSLVVFYKGFIVIVACFLSFRARNLPDALAGSKVLAVIIYITAFIGLVVLFLLYYVADVRTIVFAEILGLSAYVCVTSCLLTGPWLYVLLFRGDTEEEVIRGFGGGVMNPKKGKVGSIDLLLPPPQNVGSIDLLLNPPQLQLQTVGSFSH